MRERDRGAPPQSGWDAGIEHLGRHEVAKVVESEMVKPSSPAHPDEALGHEVWRPGQSARPTGSEDEAIFGRPHSLTS
jgi:hypothetical protein